MSDADQHIADLLPGNAFAQMRTMFRFAQLVITSILERVGDMNLDDVSSVEIQ
ncbi:hypothetical protein HC928_25575 [bacterium]|nr:hypothetical protein [bacterium]